MIHDKIALQRLALDTRTDHDSNIARAARNETKAAVKRARADFVKENLEINENDPQKFWKQINNLIPDNQNS